jgi:single-stranded-DNA-specific exonuclease
MIREAVAAGERIVIFGDYDVDGLTSTAMLVRVLRRLGANPVPIVPHRVRDGYGVNPESLLRIVDAQPQLIITVDCGSSSPSEFKQLLALGARAVVLDHHHYSGALPDAVAFVSARRPENTYPFEDLAAVGVAHSLVRALLGDDESEMYLPYVALGAIADVVSLVGENRALVARGLFKLRRWMLPGIRALCEVAGVNQRSATAWDIGFVIGPRLNAAGRVDDPQVALDLLLAENTESARPVAAKLTALNEFRQQETRRIMAEAEDQLAAMGGAAENAAIVLGDSSWSVGVAGLVAARLAERHCRPAVVLDGVSPISRGSARTAGNVNIVEALSSCADLLVRYGGHRAAAGLSIAHDHIPAFRSRLSGAVLDLLEGQMPRTEYEIDAIAGHSDLSLDTVDLLDQLEPFGHGNPQPALLIKSLRHRYAKTSRDGGHLMFEVIDDAGHAHRAIMFGSGSRLGELHLSPKIDIITRLDRNTWQGRTSLNLRIIDFRPSIRDDAR